jgi:D-3-phosphoglycerate dehydrogenase
MKNGARIINCARGGIIDEAALAAAVKEGKVAGAALDVFEQEPISPESELLKLDNVVTTCHLGASTEEAQVNVAIEVAECVRDYLLGRGVRNAANYPCLEADACKLIEPYINLAEKLGSFSSQLAEGGIKELNIVYSGEVAKTELAPLTMAVVKGILSPILKDTVNFINAVSLAKERGIKIQEVKSSEEKEFVTLISLELKTDIEVRRVAGTLSSNKQPRIVKVDDYYVEAIPFGEMLMIQNWDKPGIIGGLGSLMASYNINIATMTFGRISAGGKAISVLNVDSPITPEILDKIRKIQNVLTAKVIKI